MIAVLDWAFDRLNCTFLGHDLTTDRIYDPAAKSMSPGYRCSRCGKTQRLAYRWQDVEDLEQKGDGR